MHAGALLLSGLVLVTAGAWSHAAGVYRCEASGVVRYADKPCGGMEVETRPLLVVNAWEWHRMKGEPKAAAGAPGQSGDTLSTYNPVPFSGYRGNVVPFSSPDSNIVRSPRYSAIGSR